MQCHETTTAQACQFFNSLYHLSTLGFNKINYNPSNVSPHYEKFFFHFDNAITFSLNIGGGMESTQSTKSHKKIKEKINSFRFQFYTKKYKFLHAEMTTTQQLQLHPPHHRQKKILMDSLAVKGEILPVKMIYSQ